MININDFGKLDIRVGTIKKIEDLLQARIPAFKMEIDFGAIGIKQSCAQITDLYSASDLVGRQVIGIVNLPPKKVAGFTSEVLVLGVGNDEGAVILLKPDSNIPDGARIS